MEDVHGRCTCTAMARTYQEECSYLEQLSPCSFKIKKGFVPNMKVRLSQYYVEALVFFACVDQGGRECAPPIFRLYTWYCQTETLS